MKKLLFVILICLGCQQAHAQDPAVFQNWSLFYIYSEDPADTYDVLEIEPPIQPYLVVDEATLEFSGMGACNSFTGSLTYISSQYLFSLDSFDATSIDCGHPTHAEFEMEYFGSFIINNLIYFAIKEVGNGEQWLDIATSAAFTGLLFTNVELLALTENLKQSIKLFPNPVSETLFIASEGIPVESISIYSIAGKRVLSETSTTKQIDVSGLKSGLYFAKIATSEGKSVQKFIKK